MKLELLKPFEGAPYFTFQGFRQAAGMNSSEQIVRNLLHRWAKAGHILPLKKGVYMTRRFYEQHRGDALFSAAVSAILMPVSYLSLEFILQRHNLLTEATYPVTCVTLKTIHRVVSAVSTFWYRHLHPDLDPAILNLSGAKDGLESLSYDAEPPAKAWACLSPSVSASACRRGGRA